MKIAKILWNIMAFIGIIVTIVTVGQQGIDLANFILTTLQGAAQ